MHQGRIFVFATCVVILLGTAGCDSLFHKKKPTLPPHAQAPTVQQELPASIPEKPPVEPAPVSVAQETPKPVEQKTPPKTRRRNPAHKTTPPATTTAATTNPSASPSTNGSTTTIATNRPPDPVPNPAIAAVVPPAKATEDIQSTTQLLESAEKTVNSLDEHSLTEEQKAMRNQVKSYIEQSRKATTDGDLERALNLATKAHLLSDALVKK